MLTIMAKPERKPIVKNETFEMKKKTKKQIKKVRIEYTMNNAKLDLFTVEK